MQKDKSPESDRFTVYCFKFIWKYIGPFVFRSLQLDISWAIFQIVNTKVLILVFIRKGRIGGTYMGNLRPISLMNKDMKLASALRAGKANQKVLFAIISDTQKGLMKGRFIGKNTQLLYDLIQKNDIEGMLLLHGVYYEKAFDSI